MDTKEDAQPDPPEGRWPHLAEGLGRLAGGSAVDGPLGLLAVEEEGISHGHEA
jgi:hypothetical protein